MSTALLNTIYIAITPPIVSGVFGIIYRLIDYWLKNPSTSTNIPRVRERVRTLESRDSFSMKRVFIHIFIVQFISTFLVPVITATLGHWGVLDTFLPFTRIFLIFVLSIGFMWSGTQVGGTIRWKHLSSVAVGVIIISVIINCIIPTWVMQKPLTLISAIALFCIQTFVAMGIGGVIASVISKERELAH